MIDESKGAGATVAYKQGIPQISNLSNSRARIVLPPDSPSETLARIMINNRILPNSERALKELSANLKSLPQDYPHLRAELDESLTLAKQVDSKIGESTSAQDYDTFQTEDKE